MVGTFLAGRLARFRIDVLVGVGTAVMVCSGVVMAALAITGFLNVLTVMLPVVAYVVGYGIAFPNMTAGAIGAHPSKAGAASGLLGFIQIGSAALAGMVVGHTQNDTAVPMALAVSRKWWKFEDGVISG